MRLAFYVRGGTPASNRPSEARGGRPRCRSRRSSRRWQFGRRRRRSGHPDFTLCLPVVGEQVTQPPCRGRLHRQAPFPAPSPLRAAVGDTELSWCRGVRRGGHIDRLHLRWCPAYCFFPKAKPRHGPRPASDALADQHRHPGGAPACFCLTSPIRLRGCARPAVPPLGVVGRRLLRRRRDTWPLLCSGPAAPPSPGARLGFLRAGPGAPFAPLPPPPLPVSPSLPGRPACTPVP
jgi:hypothetical protein